MHVNLILVIVFCFFNHFQFCMQRVAYVSLKEMFYITGLDKHNLKSSFSIWQGIFQRL